MKWSYYNHAMQPDCPPHEAVDTAPIEDGSIWKCSQGKPLLARWITDFDCKEETNWWYVIKDGGYDIQSMKSKRRYEITRARKNFCVMPIAPIEWGEALCRVQIAAFSAYPEKYRPTVDRESFIKDCASWDGVCLGAFLRDEEGNATKELCGYVYLREERGCIHFFVQKAAPEHERAGVNFALVDGVLCHFKDELADGKYICDGQRSINHETAFQDYLERYFGFRKAYCRLNIAYRPSIKWMIPVLYAFRGLFRRLDGIGVVHLLNGVLKMEAVVREGRKQKNTENS